jgi:type I site-specific restriction-modification system R (restriction) subunit
MPIGSERAAVQNPLLHYAEEAGWTYLPRDDALRLRRGEESAVLHDILVRQLQRLNPGIVDAPHAEEVVKRLTRVPPNIEGNLQVWEYLKGLKTVFVESERRERNIRLLDPVNVAANTFHVTDEFAFTNGVHRIRADVVFLVNGAPVIIVETKAATHLDGIAEALEQIRRYHQQGPELIALCQLHTLTHLVQFYYGATWNLSRKALFNWRDEQAGDFETLVKTFVSPVRVLRALTDFILFTRKDEELAKVVLRPHVSMIHKFDGIAAKINERKNIFVLVDEAHRSTGIRSRRQPARSGTRMSAPRCNSGAKRIHHPPGPPGPPGRRSKGSISARMTDAARACGDASRGEVTSSPSIISAIKISGTLSRSS